MVSINLPLLLVLGFARHFLRCWLIFFNWWASREYIGNPDASHDVVFNPSVAFNFPFPGAYSRNVAFSKKNIEKVYFPTTEFFFDFEELRFEFAFRCVLEHSSSVCLGCFMRFGFVFWFAFQNSRFAFRVLRPLRYICMASSRLRRYRGSVQSGPPARNF